MIFSILINTWSSYKVSTSDRHSIQKFWALLGVVVNLGVLAFFKYASLIVSTLFSNWREMGGLAEFIIRIPLPIGISFFTFQGISLVVDVFKEKEGKSLRLPVRNFKEHLMNTAFFKALFPQLVAGPIVKAHDFYFQIGPKQLRDVDWYLASRELIAGYFLKSVVADNLKDQTFWMSYPYFLSFSSRDLVFMLFGYSMQIFADFAGYSYIALGTARLFGYKLPENFNWPYISTSFSEFWRRWHISLSSFLREYLYIPLGGNRKGPVRTYMNLFIVMFLGGLWHGAAWSYAVWGSAHGLALAIERLLADRLNRVFRIVPDFLMIICKWFLVFSVVTLAWLLFKLPNFSEVVSYVNAIFHNTHIESGKTRIFLILLYSLPVMILHFWQPIKKKDWAQKWQNFDYVFYAILFFLWVVNHGSSGAFIYFQF